MKLLSFILAMLSTCYVAADEATRAIGLRAEAVFRPVTEEAPSGNVGLFVGVNLFTEDNDIPPLRFAVHDAVEQAYMFVARLKLIPPKNCYLALSGEPSADSVQQHLDELTALGVNMVEATNTSLLKTTVKVCRVSTEKTNVAIIGISSHGFDDGTVPYVMPSDGLREFPARTAIRLRDIEDQLQNSKAGHKLLLIDACQEKVLVGVQKGGGVRSTTPMSPVFAEALKHETGQAKLASCDVGQFSYEYPELRGCGHGVFTSALLDALDGGAYADSENVIRIKSVADYVSTSVTDWVNEQNRQRSQDLQLAPQTPAWFGPKTAEAIPLAVKAGDVASVIATLQKRRLPRGFTDELREMLVLKLQTLDATNSADQELLTNTQDYLNGKVKPRLFIAFLREMNFESRTDAPGTSKNSVSEAVAMTESAVKPPATPESSDRNWTIEGSRTGDLREPNSLGMKFVWVAPGGHAFYKVVEDSGNLADLTLEVTIGKGFWIGQTEVTQKQWKQLMKTEPWRTGNTDYVAPGQLPYQIREGDEYAASCISWYDASNFVSALTHSERASGRIPQDWQYSLPDRTYWLIACSAGTTTRFSFGNSENDLDKYAWFNQNSSDVGERYAHEVMKKRPNPWGLFDMHGNVAEWLAEEPGDHVNLADLAGGSWNYHAFDCIPGRPDGNTRRAGFPDYGLRVVLTPIHP